MRAKFMELKCPDKGNAKDFLDDRSTIISSLPVPLANFASNQLAAAKLYVR